MQGAVTLLLNGRWAPGSGYYAGIASSQPCLGLGGTTGTSNVPRGWCSRDTGSVLVNSPRPWRDVEGGAVGSPGRQGHGSIAASLCSSVSRGSVFSDNGVRKGQFEKSKTRCQKTWWRERDP